MDTDAALLEKVRARRWFYEFDLPDGTRTRPQVPAGVEAIHTTRQLMIDAVLDQTLGRDCFQRELKGIFGILDETDETEGPETGMHGICLAPSIPALAWMLERVGFSSVVRVHPPADGYEQLVRGRRAMFVAAVERKGVR